MDAVTSGRIDVGAVDEEALPSSMQGMGPKEKQALVAKKSRDRVELQEQIKTLAAKRSDYLKQKVEETGGAEKSLDHKIYRAVREQAAVKGLRYEHDAPEY